MLELSQLLPSAFVALIATLTAIPLTIIFANKFGLVDDPNKRPHPAHVQNRIVPRAGGLAIYLGLTITTLLYFDLTPQITSIWISTSILLIMGLLDDKVRNFNPYFRLMLLFLSAWIVVSNGISISFITNPLAGFNDVNSALYGKVLFLDEIAFMIGSFPINLAQILSFFWIVILTQVVNWSKGVDGQMPGITLITSLTLGFLSLKFFYQGDLNQLEIAKLAFIVSGVSLGFLIFNWYPAKIFPGFSGSTILAFMVAVLAIMSGAKLATAILVLAVPSADFIYTFFRRLLNGKSPVWGDRGHLHHQLLNLGWSHPSISLFYIFGSAILGLFALLIDIQSKAFVALGLIIVIMGVILWINSLLGKDIKDSE